MRADLHLPRGEKIYELALEGLVLVNEYLYRQGNLPDIYSAGVRYRPERTEAWRNAAEVVRDKWGDCEDLAAARAGQLRASGEQGAKVIVRRTGPKMTHALVRRANGTIEDPSRRLGMKGADQVGGIAMSRYPGYDSVGAAPRFSSVVRAALNRGSAVKRPVVQVNAIPVQSLPPALQDSEPNWGPDPDSEYGEYESKFEMSPVEESDWEQIGADVSNSAEISWSVNRTPAGWQGVVRVPLDAGRALLVSRGGATEKQATTSALKAASNVLDSDLAKALIPPQAQAVLKMLRSPTAQKAGKVALQAAKKLKFW